MGVRVSSSSHYSFYYFLYAEIAQLVEHNLAKVGVAGPSPVFRSSLNRKTYLFLYIIKMNLYLRYFDYETLVYSVEEAIDFLASIPEIGMDVALEADIRNYVASDMFYPKRYKIRPRVYFIIIKTTAATMEDFKQKKAVNPQQVENIDVPPTEDIVGTQNLTDVREGWYDGQLDFKRVAMIPQSGKFEYKDTHVQYQCKAISGLDCYNRIVEYLRTRVDRRSQFPSAKGKNFKFAYLGKWK